MLNRELAHRLGAQDYAFLLMDHDDEPMNIGSVAIFEGDVSLDKFVENIASKLDLIPRYTQVVVPAPFNVGRPTWEADPNFNINRHIHEKYLDAPGSLEQLLEFAGDVHARRLDRGKPLWEAYLVRGLEGDRTALVTTIHHCLVDGVGGVELALVMLDTSPDPATVSKSRPVEHKPLPSRRQVLTDAILDDFEEALDHWTDWQNRFLGLLDTAGRGWARGVRSGVEAALPYFAFPVQKTSFNRKLSPKRRLAVSAFDLAEFRQVKTATGTTINDVALAMVGAAVGAYLRERGEPTKRRKLRVLTPVNVRRPDQSGGLGNHISMLLVEVPLWEMSPLKRLHAASRRMAWLKTEHASEGVEMIAGELLSLPTPMLKILTALGSPPNTVANMVCTNVAGPAMPLYTVGHRMIAHYPISPLSWQMGLSCAITSYHGEITFTLVCDPLALADVDHLAGLLVDAYADMRAAVAKSDDASEVFEEIEASIEAGEIAAMER